MKGSMRTAIVACVALASCGGDDDDSMNCVGDNCMPSTCDNGMQDVDETDIDCGGATCRQCPGARGCTAASDCFSGNCVAGQCFALTVSFAPEVVYEGGFKPYVMMSDDLDGDGDIDLAVANEIENNVVMYANAGDGAFTRTTSGMTDYYPTGGAIADFNGDGIPDVATANYHGNSVSILLGQGTGESYVWLPANTFPTVAGAETSNLAVGDLDGDALPDVIATNPQASSASLFMNSGDGLLGAATNIGIGTGESEPYSVAIGDFDNDGKNDAAIADNRTLSLDVMLGNGDGTLRFGTTRPMIAGAASFIVIAHDVDLDGNLDLVVANRSSDNISVLLGLGTGELSEALVSPTGMMTGPYSLAVADFNKDGVPDVITANFMASSASVMLGIGNGRFDPPIDTGMTGVYTYGITAADFNGDGKPDFATANAGSNNISVKISTAQ